MHLSADFDIPRVTHQRARPSLRVPCLLNDLPRLDTSLQGSTAARETIVEETVDVASTVSATVNPYRPTFWDPVQQPTALPQPPGYSRVGNNYEVLPSDFVISQHAAPAHAPDNSQAPYTHEPRHSDFVVEQPAPSAEPTTMDDPETTYWIARWSALSDEAWRHGMSTQAYFDLQVEIAYLWRIWWQRQEVGRIEEAIDRHTRKEHARVIEAGHREPAAAERAASLDARIAPPRREDRSGNDGPVKKSRCIQRVDTGPGGGDLAPHQ